MQTLREEIKKRDDQTLKTQHDNEARIRDVEAQLQQEIESRPRLGEDWPGQPLDEEMELITTEVATALSVVAGKQKAKSSEGSNINIQNSARQQGRGRRVAFQDEECRTADFEMDSDGDRRNAGTSYQFQEPDSPLPVVGPP